MIIRRLLLCLLAASVHTTLAAPHDGPMLLLEQGVFAMDNLHDTNKAKGLFRAVIANPKVPERLAVEALWHMTDAF